MFSFILGVYLGVEFLVRYVICVSHFEEPLVFMFEVFPLCQRILKCIVRITALLKTFIFSSEISVDYFSQISNFWRNFLFF